MAEEVLHNFRMLNAKEVIFTGFRDDRSIAASQIDAAKECMLQMNYVMTVAFAFHAISQVSELLTNKKPLSPFVGTLKIDLMEGAESEMSAEALAWILSRAFDDASTDLRQLSKVSVRVRRLRSAISLVQSIIQVFHMPHSVSFKYFFLRNKDSPPPWLTTSLRMSAFCLKFSCAACGAPFDRSAFNSPGPLQRSGGLHSLWSGYAGRVWTKTFRKPYEALSGRSFRATTVALFRR